MDILPLMYSQWTSHNLVQKNLGMLSKNSNLSEVLSSNSNLLSTGSNRNHVFGIPRSLAQLQIAVEISFDKLASTTKLNT